MDPHVIRARAELCVGSTGPALEIGRFEHYTVTSDTAEHVLVHENGTWLRLDIVAGTVLAGSAMLELMVPLHKLESQFATIRKLDALLRNASPPRENDPRLFRLVLALRALDARAEGVSLRELAFGVFGASDWPGDGDHVKSRVRRLVRLADELRRAGPRGVLARQV